MRILLYKLELVVQYPAVRYHVYYWTQKLIG
jgi:hypothetical protein